METGARNRAAAGELVRALGESESDLFLVTGEESELDPLADSTDVRAAIERWRAPRAR